MKRILCLCLVLVLCLSLAACGGSKSAPVVGTWYYADYPDDSYYVVLYKNGTGSMKFGSATPAETFSWVYSSSTHEIRLTSEAGEKATGIYNAANDTILISYYTLIRK